MRSVHTLSIIGEEDEGEEEGGSQLNESDLDEEGERDGTAEAGYLS